MTAGIITITTLWNYSDLSLSLTTWTVYTRWWLVSHVRAVVSPCSRRKVKILWPKGFRESKLVCSSLRHPSHSASHTQTNQREIKLAQSCAIMLLSICTICTHAHFFSTTVIQYQYNKGNVDTWELYHIYLQYHVCRVSFNSSAFWEMQSVTSL